MFAKKTVVTAAVTMLIAAATGYYMENQLVSVDKIDGPAPRPNGPSRAAPKVDLSKVLPEATPTASQQSVQLHPALSSPPSLALTPIAAPVDVANRPDTLLPTPAMDLVPEPAVEDIVNLSAVAPDCTPKLSRRPGDGAMIVVDLVAECDPNSVVTVSHAGLVFSQATDPQGRSNFTVPALTRAAVITVATPTGEKATTSISVPDVAHYDRVALQWSGRSDLSIHALEFGAGYGTDGHVSSVDPKTAERAIAADGGFLTRLGDHESDHGNSAEVYSFPTGAITREGVVRLSIEASVTDASCGQTLNAETIQTAGDGTVDRLTISINMPECDALGDILVLKNLLRDLKIAQN